MKDLNIPEEEKKISKAIDDVLPDEETTKDLIISELAKVVETLGGMSDILCIVGSYNDTQTDEETLDSLIEWNEHYSKFRNPDKFSHIYNRQ
jgi:hypothetical protein